MHPIVDSGLPNGVTHWKIDSYLHCLRCETCKMNTEFNPLLKATENHALRRMLDHICTEHNLDRGRVHLPPKSGRRARLQTEKN